MPRGPAPAFDSQNRTCVAVQPHRLAGGQVVAGDDLVLAALLLGVDEVAADRERRPARPDRPAPQLDRRRGRPVGRDPHAAHGAVAPRPEEAGPIGSPVRPGQLHVRRRRRGCGRRGAGLGPGRCRGARRSFRCGPGRGSRRNSRRRRLAAGLGAGHGGRRSGRKRCRRCRNEGLVGRRGQEPLLGSRRPPPGEVVLEIAGEAVGPDQRPPQAGEQEDHDHRRAPRPGGEIAGGRRPSHQGEGEHRDGKQRQQHALRTGRDRLVDQQ